MMTNQQISLVQESWKKVLPIAGQAGQLFYSRLFEIAPTVRPMFPKNITNQSKKLMSILGVVVSKLDRLDTIIGEVKKLAVRHNDYGVEADHYTPVGEALLWTLEQGLGSKWNEELKEAWATAFITLSSAMIEAQENSKANISVVI